MYDSITKLQELLDANCRIEKVHPPLLASDAEINIVVVSLTCPDGKTHTIKAYREEALSVREFVRLLKK
ncbi:MAG TPA: hypothetical protein VIB07_05620 [Nitrososphaera sp.]|jgi:hypothetical protein